MSALALEALEVGEKCAIEAAVNLYFAILAKALKFDNKQSHHESRYRFEYLDSKPMLSQSETEVALKKLKVAPKNLFRTLNNLN